MDLQAHGRTADRNTQEKKLMAANESLHDEIEERKLHEEKIKLLNLQLLDNNIHLQAVNEELDQFAYVASHDLQEPLRKIMVFSDKIRSIQEDQQQVEKYLAKIRSSSARMQLLINNLLKFSRYSLNAADYVSTDLNDLLANSLSELEMEIEKNEIIINTGKLPVIEAVPELMQQVFSNLINNAIKFRAKNAKPVVNIFCTQKSNADPDHKLSFLNDIRYYEISVSDNGIGFENQYAEDIFMAFKRLHSFHDFEGTGVGLSICKKIIEKHNGSISASGRANKGATFRIILPEKQAQLQSS